MEKDLHKLANAGDAQKGAQPVPVKVETGGRQGGGSEGGSDPGPPPNQGSGGKK